MASLSAKETPASWEGRFRVSVRDYQAGSIRVDEAREYDCWTSVIYMGTRTLIGHDRFTERSLDTYRVYGSGEILRYRIAHEAPFDFSAEPNAVIELPPMFIEAGTSLTTSDITDIEGLSTFEERSSRAAGTFYYGAVNMLSPSAAGTTSEEQCARLCLTDERCASWTHAGYCRLSTEVPAKVAQPGSTSGARIALLTGVPEARPQIVEVDPAHLRGVGAVSGACAEAVQGKIAWDYAGHKQWNGANVQRLCEGAEGSAEPARCFALVMHSGISRGGGTQWQWGNALSLCSGSRDASGTVDCFERERDAGKTWQQAVEICATNPLASPLPSDKAVTAVAIEPPGN